MAGSRKKIEPHSFYCINCGKPGIPVWRKSGSQRKKNHLKALYCTNCKLTINHVEIRTEDEAEQFKLDFSNGKYKAAAEKSIAYAIAKEEKR